MDWFTVHGAMRDNRKWMELSPVGRGAWTTLMLIGHSQPTRWALGDRLTVLTMLKREGFPDPESTLDELLEAVLVDDEDGVLSMHDAGEWQKPKPKPSDAPKEVQKRVRKHRAEHAGKRGKRGETPGNALQDKTGDDRTDKTDELASQPASHMAATQNGRIPRPSSVMCPTCTTGEVVVKNGTNGPFTGCNRYPECRYTGPAPAPRKRGDTPLIVYMARAGGLKDGRRELERLASLENLLDAGRLMAAIRLDPAPRDGAMLERLEQWAKEATQ
jgi:hypothetical protein